jgi:hypothetical protein
VHSTQISCPLWSWALWLCAHEKMNVRSLETNRRKEEVGGCSPTLG